MLTRPYVTEGKDENVAILDKEGKPRLKQDENNNIVAFTADDLTKEILTAHSYLLAASSKGGGGGSSQRSGIETKTIDKVSSMDGQELSEYMNSLSDKEQKEILEQIKT